VRNRLYTLRGIFAALFVLSGLILPCIFVAQAESNRANDTGLSKNLVMLDVIVTDKKNLLVKNLKRDHFTVFDDNVKQSIAFFSDEEEPVSIGIMLDVSSSMRFRDTRDKGQPIDLFKDYFLPFLKRSHTLNDYFIMSFDNQPQVLSDWTRDKDLLMQSINKISSPKGATALYDACIQAIEKTKSGANRKKVIILLSDGWDSISKHNLNEFKRLVKQSDVRFYPITVIATDSADPAIRFNHLVLKEIASLSGGTYFYVSGAENIVYPLNQIIAELKYQYTIGYYPPKSDDQWHEVQVKIAPVEIKDGLKPDKPAEEVVPTVRTRQGYYAK
jgi:Ca-activated chloride channel family protein